MPTGDIDPKQELAEIERDLRRLTLQVNNLRTRAVADARGQRSNQPPPPRTPRVGDQVIITVNGNRTQGRVVGETEHRLKVKVPGSILPVYRAHRNVTIAQHD